MANQDLPKTAVTVKPYQAVYPVGVRFEAGEPVEILKADPEYPGWLWCRTSRGEEAWAPEAFIEPILESATGRAGEEPSLGRMRRDYDSTELNVAEGERVTVLEAVAGWAWIEDSRGRRGWIEGSGLIF